MRALRIGQVAGGVDLVRLDFLQQVRGDLGVLVGPAAVALGCGLIKRQIEKMKAFGQYAADAGRAASLGPADGSLHAHRIGLGRGRIQPHVLEKIGVTLDHLIAHLAAAGNLINDVDRVALLRQPRDRAADRARAVARMRRKNHDALGKNGRRRLEQGPRLLDRIGLAAGPAGDRVLELAEDAQVELVGVAALGEEVLQRVRIIILVGKLEHRLAGFAGQPRHGASHHRVVPREVHFLERPDDPRRAQAGQAAGRGLVEHEQGILVVL